jgi:hypothetical protein
MTSNQRFEVPKAGRDNAKKALGSRKEPGRGDAGRDWSESTKDKIEGES